MGNQPLPNNNTSIAAAYCDLNDVVYLFGGNFSSGYFDLIQKFDPNTETFTELSLTLPHDLGGITAIPNSLENVIYLIGGQNSSGMKDVVYKFNCNDETLEEAGNLHITLSMCGAEYIPDKKRIYVFGGTNEELGGYWPATNNVYYATLTGGNGGLNLTYNQIDGSNFPIIHSYVTVTDNQGNPINGLTAANFTVQEDGINESPITVTQMGGGAVPISAALVIDRSGSMDGQPIQDAKTAAKTFVNQMGTNDKAAIISFSTSVSVNQSFTSNKNLLINAINSIYSDGYTAIYDACIEAVNQIHSQSGRKAIILMTDGGDNSSSSSIQEAINSAMQGNVPVFTIGLGLSQGSSEEQQLQQIANNTGGHYYYAPNSSDLQQIYQLISQQLQNQYKITYTTHNTNRDGTTRTVQITANYQGKSDTKTKTYVAPTGGGGVPISLSTINPQVTAGEEFWLEINVGSSSSPVTDLKIVSFELNYTNTLICDYVSIEVGTFITGAQASIIPDDQSGKISASVYRTSGGNSGSGIVLRLKFKISTSASQGQTVCFSFGTIQANSSSGGTINLTPSGTVCAEVEIGVPVWPGDANNDGQVSIFDINSVVAIYWEKTGYVRTNASIQWTAQMCQPWNPKEATYADCNGDGVVNIFDINSIIINFGKTHGLLCGLHKLNDNSLLNPPLSIEARDYNNTTQEFWIDIIVGSSSSPVSNLKVISFELTYSNTTNIDYVSFQTGNFLNDSQANVIVDDTNGKISASVYRTSGGNSGHGVALSIKFKAGFGNNVDFGFAGVLANGTDGSTIPLTPVGKSLVTNVESRSKKSIDFALDQNYPNPFNPKTTINFNIPKKDHIKLEIFNYRGETVSTLFDNVISAGSHSVEFNANDLPSGVYFYKLQVEGFSQVKKMLLVK